MFVFLKASIVGFVLFAASFTIAFAADKACVSFNQARADMVAHGVVVGELRTELLARVKAAVVAKATNSDVVAGAKDADKAYGVFGIGDGNHVVMLFVKNDCITAAVIFEAGDLHALLEPKK